jgi:hypothetical protein
MQLNKFRWLIVAGWLIIWRLGVIWNRHFLPGRDYQHLRDTTMIRKICLVAAFCALPTLASAQGMGGYIEGNIGAAFISNVDAKVDDTPPGTASIDVGTELLFGAEVGVGGLGNANNLRFGLGWDHLKVTPNSVTLSGFGDPTEKFTCSELASFTGGDATCSDFGTNANIVALNAYLDFPTGNNMGIVPFIGVGAGWAFLEDADSQFAASGSAGVRIPLGMNAYVGARYRFQYITGPSEDLADFDAITSHGVSAILGMNF